MSRAEAEAEQEKEGVSYLASKSSRHLSDDHWVISPWQPPAIFSVVQCDIDRQSRSGFGN